MSSAAENVSDPIRQWVTFSLAGESYGIDVMSVQEVLRLTDIAPVPGAPHFVLGIINLRGSVVTVIDARTRLGFPTQEPTDVTRIVILEVAGQVMGMLVDSVAEVVEFRESDIESTPNVQSDDGAKFMGVFTRGDDLLIVVDLERFLAPDEVGAF